MLFRSLFSMFSGYNRSILKIEGGDITLQVLDSKFECQLDKNIPYYFDGDQKISATLCGPPVKDFNVFTKKGKLRHTLSTATLADEHEKTFENKSTSFIYCVRGHVKVESNFELNANESAILYSLMPLNIKMKSIAHNSKIVIVSLFQ